MSEQTLFEVDETLTVGQINRQLNNMVSKTFPNDLWVQGQIRNLSRSARGHVYFDLVDPVPAGEQPKAAIAVTLFDSNRQIVNRVINRTGNTVRIDDGVEVRIKAAVDFYAPRGQVQLNMTSIDPDFTLGRLGADREQLLRELKAQSLIEANAQIPLALVPLRVALVTSDGSAAQADFIEQISATRYAFSITTLATRVQGEFAAEEIAAAIAYAGALDIDVIAVVRGGGARTDLAAFDTEPVARAIATSARPVICGIGHEIDSSVADLVAHSSLKTPTACAQFLIERVVAFDVALTERSARLAAAARLIPSVQATLIDRCAQQTVERVERSLALARARNTHAANGLERRVGRALARAHERLVGATAQVKTSARHVVTAAERRCEQHRERLVALPIRALSGETQRLNLLDARLSAVDPVQALRRGYSITTTDDGILVRSTHDITTDSVLITRLADGTVTSTVTDSKPNEDPQ